MTTLTLPPPHELSIAASAEQLKALQDQIRAVIEAGEAPLAAIREMCGPDALGIAGELLKRLNYGLGMFRECDATLSSLWRAKNSKRYETSPQRQEQSGEDREEETNLPAKPGETPGEARGLHAALSGVETGEAEAPLCISGGRIEMRHDFDRLTMKCKCCNYQLNIDSLCAK